MDGTERDAVVASLELLVRCKEAIGEYYRVCAEAWPADRGFWLGLADDEATHAARLELLGERARDDGVSARVDRLFPRAALETFVAGVVQVRARVLDGRVTRGAALALSQDFERSLIESRALRAIELSVPGWRSFLGAIAVDTLDHLLRVEERWARESAAAA